MQSTEEYLDQLLASVSGDNPPQGGDGQLNMSASIEDLLKEYEEREKAEEVEKEKLSETAEIAETLETVEPEENLIPEESFDAEEIIETEETPELGDTLELEELLKMVENSETDVTSETEERSEVEDFSIGTDSWEETLAELESVIPDEEPVAELESAIPDEEPVAAPSDGGNLDPDQIAALFASMGGGEEAEPEQPQIEEPEIEVPQMESLEIEEPEEEVILQEEYFDPDEMDLFDLPEKAEIHPERMHSDTEDLEETEEEDDDDESEEAEGDQVLEGLSEKAEENSDLSLDEDMLMNLEDVDALLASAENVESEPEDVSEGDFSEDSELAEINDILQKSDNNEVLEDDLLSMLDGLDHSEENANPLAEGISEEKAEEEPAEDKKKKKKKKGKEKKGENSDAENAEESEPKDKKAKKEKKKKEKAEATGEKKPSLLDKIKAFVFAPDDEEEENGEASGESQDGAGTKEKKKKDKKAKKGSGDVNADIEAELEAEDKKGKKKEKKEKPKKEKKPKPEKKVQEELEEKGKTIGTKGTAITLFVCLTLLAIILIFCYLVPTQLQLGRARLCYYSGNYKEASMIFYGRSLSKSDQILYEKSTLLSTLEIRFEKYNTYTQLEKDREALNALFEARTSCVNCEYDAELMGIKEEVIVIRDQIDNILMSKYKLSLEQIEEICEMKSLYYTIAVDNLVAGKSYNELPERLKEDGAPSENTDEVNTENAGSNEDADPIEGEEIMENNDLEENEASESEMDLPGEEELEDLLPEE